MRSNVINCLVIAMVAGISPPVAAAAEGHVAVTNALWYAPFLEVRGSILFDPASSQFTFPSGDSFRLTRTDSSMAVVDGLPVLESRAALTLLSGPQAGSGYFGIDRIFNGQYGIATLVVYGPTVNIVYPLAMDPIEFAAMMAEIVALKARYEVEHAIPIYVPPGAPPHIRGDGTGRPPVHEDVIRAAIEYSERYSTPLASEGDLHEILRFQRSVRNTGTLRDPRGEFIETSISTSPRFNGRDATADEIQLAVGFQRFVHLDAWSPALYGPGDATFSTSSDGTPIRFYSAVARPNDGARSDSWSVSVAPEVSISYGFFGISINTEIRDKDGASVRRFDSRVVMQTDFEFASRRTSNERAIGLTVGIGAVDGFPGFYDLRVSVDATYVHAHQYKGKTGSSQTFYLVDELRASPGEIYVTFHVDNWTIGTGDPFGVQDITVGRRYFYKDPTRPESCTPSEENLLGTAVVARDKCQSWKLITITEYGYRFGQEHTPDVTSDLWYWNGEEYESIVAGACGSVYDHSVAVYILACGYFLPREDLLCPTDWPCVTAEGHYYEMTFFDDVHIQTQSFVVERH